MKRRSKSNKKINKKANKKMKERIKHMPDRPAYDPMKKKIIIAAIAGAIILISIAALCISLSREKSFSKTLKELNEIDEKNGMSLHDYENGVAYMKYHPRYPDEINLNEFEGVIGDLEGVHELFHNLRKDTAAKLLVDARVALLDSEQHYRLATKTVKGLTADGFKCSDRPYVEEATKNFNMSVKQGRIAVEALARILDEYPEEAKQLDISNFWIKNLNQTYDEIDDVNQRNVNTIVYFCSKEMQERADAASNAAVE